MIVDPDVVEV